ncbi:hypothetical protein PanWU01x14_256310 [Parasponia andersonii]|uniref:Uncharacterized protein n=1 Tax=Parasponia andersonii TaxID=3476 RepID=A0A2P5BAG0_PARAD|nr:hypothetical protein PanWU01x14_256310 [Parasponia andersonii]
MKKKKSEPKSKSELTKPRLLPVTINQPRKDRHLFVLELMSPLPLPPPTLPSSLSIVCIQAAKPPFTRTIPSLLAWKTSTSEINSSIYSLI